MRKILLIAITVLSALNLTAMEIPVPENHYLFTKFEFERTAPFLRNPVKGEGIIVMSGKDRFLFNQIKPVEIKIIMNQGSVSYQKGDAKPIVMSGMPDDMDNGNIAVLFSGDTERINEFFNIEYKKENGKDYFLLKPLSDNKQFRTVDSIDIISSKDKIEIIKLNYKNRSVLKYVFKDTVTGIMPDEKYFN